MTEDPVVALARVIGLLAEHADTGDRVAAAWAAHFAIDKRSLAIWWMAHSDEAAVLGGTPT